MFVFHVTDFADATHVAWHEQVPGVKCFGRNVYAGENCAWIVQSILDQANAKYTLTDKRRKVKATWPATLKPTVRDIPIRDWLMPHQKNGVKFALTREGSLLHHAPGAGKTASAIIWAAFDDAGRTVWVTRAISKMQHETEIQRLTTCKTQILWGEGPTALNLKIYTRPHRLAKGATFLLSSPDASLIGQTDAQGEYVVKKTAPGAYTLRIGPNVILFNLSPFFTTELVLNLESGNYQHGTTPTFDPDAQFIIINWEIIPFWYESLIQHGFTSLVLDELHKAKNPVRYLAAYHAKTDKTKFLPKQNIAYAAMCLSRKAKRRLGLTATPVKDRVRDIWAQMDLLEPNEWGSRKAFMERYANRHVNEYGGIDDRGSSNLDELKKRFVLSTHRASVTETHKNLPPLRRETITIPSSEQSSTNERSIAAELAGKGPVEAAIAIAASRKREAIYELIEEPIINGQHCAVFTNRRDDADDLAKRIQKRVKDCLVVMIHGGIPVGPKRENLRTAYMNAKGAAVLVATGDSMGEAIDLNKTDLAVMAQLPYTWTQLDQWEKRFYRLGQDRPVRIIYPIAQGTIDERIVSVLLNKLPPVQEIAHNADLNEMRRAILGGKSDEEIQQDLVDFLLSPRETA